MNPHDRDLVARNKKMGAIFFAIVLGMIALTFASVPLYRMFCQLTGYDGTPRIDPNAVASKVLDQEITIRFNADVARGMPWQFVADKPSETLKIGQKGLATFTARNPTDASMEGTAIFNVLPETAGPYFHKTQCFCFGRQALDAKQSAQLPVMFFVDPSIVDDPDLKGVSTITLSYTFFKADSPELDAALDKLGQAATPAPASK